MDREQFEKRKKMIYELICDELYVPMKIREMAILLSVPKEKRQELQEVLDALIAEGRSKYLKRANIQRQKAIISQEHLQAIREAMDLLL